MEEITIQSTRLVRKIAMRGDRKLGAELNHDLLLDGGVIWVKCFENLIIGVHPWIYPFTKIHVVYFF
jgi:hypothetical protein